ncbi:MAG: 1-(5-phosphoribosyl)-5-[(5-phosphoribosylamino)methylideneamino]imidazole-4-carboxamide isomerase [Bdellovibrionales bacterium]
MLIFPAIDLQEGRCVRLVQGDFNQSKTYSADPLQVAQGFAAAGARWVHMVDLDGARDGAMKQLSTIKSVAQTTTLRIQAGGGIRSEAAIQNLLDAGVSRVVIGSLAVESRQEVRGWLRKFGPERIVLAFDVRENDGQPEVVTQGWQSGTQQTLWDVLDSYEGSGLRAILCTDVSRDGMLQGPNEGLYRLILEKAPQIELLASGGVGKQDDILSLAATGVAGAIVGKAIYEGKVDLAEAIRSVEKE